MDAGVPARLRRGDAGLAGPLDQGQKAFFAITPMPDDWTRSSAESYLREDNGRMLRLLTIHEAVPGTTCRASTQTASVAGPGVFRAACSPRAGPST